MKTLEKCYPFGTLIITTPHTLRLEREMRDLLRRRYLAMVFRDGYHKEAE